MQTLCRHNCSKKEIIHIIEEQDYEPNSQSSVGKLEENREVEMSQNDEFNEEEALVIMLVLALILSVVLPMTMVATPYLIQEWNIFLLIFISFLLGPLLFFTQNHVNGILQDIFQL